MRNNRTGNIFRIIAGAYLAYLGVQLVTQTIQQKPTNEIFNIVMGVLFIVVGAWFAIGALRGILKEQKQEREKSDQDTRLNSKSTGDDMIEAVKDTEEGSETERIEKETETTEERAEKTAEIKEETATVQEKEPDAEKQENEKAEELETDYEEK